MGDQVIDLAPEPGAADARLVAIGDGDPFVRTRGRRALVSLAGRRLPECIDAAALPFRATGSTPDWLLDFDGVRLRLLRDMGAVRDEGPQPLPGPDTDAIVPVADWGWVVLRQATCRDGRTGVPHPFTATVDLVTPGAADGPTPAAVLTGFGGDPRSLLTGSPWGVVSISGGAPPPEMPVRLGFSAAALSLIGPCNRAVADYDLSGPVFALHPIATSATGCAPGTLASEAALRDLLTRLSGFDIDAASRLQLRTGDGRLLTATRRRACHDPAARP